MSEGEIDKGKDFEPVSSVDFIDPKRDGVDRSVGANIMPNGDLMISGLDWGSLAHRMQVVITNTR